jgi:hypothetical protein
VTAQIGDVFRYRGREYELAGISEGDLFEPRLFGLEPVGMCTACYRGYQALFAVAGARLVLDELHVGLMRPGGGYQRQAGPVINGVTPAGPANEHDWFNNHYVGLEYHFEYTGGLLLADGFIQELYVHMGFHPPWKYQTVIELVFDRGVLKGAFDRSERMAAIRALIGERGGPPAEDAGGWNGREDIAHFIERAFDRRYHL